MPLSATITIIGNSNNPGCFSAPVSFTITVNPTPSVDPVAHQFFCNENLTSVISFTGQQPGTVFNWTNNNTSIGLAASGTGDIPSFTPAITSINPVDANIIVVPSYTNNGVTCSTAGRDFTITIKPLPIVNDVPNKIVCNGATSNIQFTSYNGLANYFTWTNSNPSIGIPASGTGNIADFIAINNGTTPVTATITVTPYRNLINNIDCEGQSKTFTITVNPTPTVNNITEQTFCNGSTTSEIVLSGNVPGTNFVWINSNNSIGLASNGNGNIPSFIATNPNSTASIASILVTPQTGSGINTCTGPQVSFLINVRPTITPVVTASGPLTFCSNSNVTLTSDQPSGNLWSNGATTNSITVNASGTYTVTSTDMFGCSSSVSNPVTVTVNPFLAPAVTISASATVICANTRPTFTASLSNLTAVAYNWKKNGVLAAITSTYAPALVQSGDIIICEVLGTNGCTNGSVNVVSNAIQLTIQPLANAGTINGLSTVAAGYNYPYTSNGNTGGVWASSNPSVLTIDPSTGISTTLIPGVTTITYTLLTGCGAPRTASKQVQVVAVTSPIVGSDYVCPQTTAISYSLAPTIPSGGTWSISNTSLATITVQSGTDRIISFTPVQTGSVTISYTLPGNVVIDKIVQIMNVPVLGPITGPRNLCEFRGTNNVFTDTKEPVNPITGYQWTVPSALTIVGGQGTSSLLVRLSTGYVPSDIYQLVATPVGFNCPVSAEAITLSSSVPQTPLPIIASASDICQVIGTNVPVTYTIPKVAGAASYIWQAQPGTTITHPNGLGKNDTTVQVTFSNAVATGTISVSAVNGCGASNTRGFTITRAIPATPGLISGPKAICAHIAPGGTVATYTVAQQPSVTSYNWSVPAGAIGLAGQGTNSISFTYPADYSGGTISVVAINGCGTSTTRSLSVSRLNPSMPSVIDVINITDCPNRQYIYSLNSMPANATSVQWTTPGLILSGQGTSSIRVLYPQGAIIGTVTATAISNCGSSSTRKLDVKIPACPPEFAGSAGNAGAKGLSVDLKPVQSFTAELFPNPAINDFFIRINSPDKYSSVQIRVLDAQGKEMSRMKIMPEETISAGHLLQPGIYFIEMIQGVNRQVHKLIKQ
ncbi:MAG: T9SS type A sorting domain-containing protein [Ferruginibacter sp.]